MGNGTFAVYSVPAPAPSLALRAGPVAAVRAALLAARERTLRLADDFRSALGPRPHLPYAAELNPPLWELGHIAWFQEWWTSRNSQRALGLRASALIPRGSSLLQAADDWYDSSRVPHRSRWELPLPDDEGTRHYLERTLEATLRLLDALPQDAGHDALYFYRLCAMHEQMHAEAAVYMAQGLGIPVSEAGEPPRITAGGELTLREQRFELGSAGEGFAFDNELCAHEAHVGRITIDAAPVTWGAFLPFVEAGGYEDLRWWSQPGRAWLAGLRVRQPANLRAVGPDWQQVRDGRWQAVPHDEVALHLSAHEADAWCRWAGRRLPSEAEWECAAFTAPGFQWGQAWEWTASDFEPYPGFEPHPYRDYSAPWFNTRRVLRGASPATAPELAHARYRNFFEPHRRDIFAGFRSVRVGASAVFS